MSNLFGNSHANAANASRFECVCHKGRTDVENEELLLPANMRKAVADQMLSGEQFHRFTRERTWASATEEMVQHLIGSGKSEADARLMAKTAMWEVDILELSSGL